MKQVAAYTYPIGQKNTLSIKSKGCFKVVIKNASSGTITVAGLPIEAGEKEVFDGLPPDTTFNRDFELTMDESVFPEVYVTCYTYVENDKC